METPTPTSARRALELWKAARPANYGLEPHLTALNAAYCGDSASRNTALLASTGTFGALVASDIGERAKLYTQPENEPRLQSHDEFGNRVERIILHPAHREAGRAQVLHHHPHLAVGQRVVGFDIHRRGHRGA